MSIVSLNLSDEKSISYVITRSLSDFAVARLIRKHEGEQAERCPVLSLVLLACRATRKPSVS